MHGERKGARGKKGERGKGKGERKNNKCVNKFNLKDVVKLLATTETKDQVKSRLLLDVVIREGAAILQLLSGEDKTLLVRGDTLLVLDLLFHGLDGIRRLDFEGDGLPSEGLHEDLHSSCCLLLLGKVVVVGRKVFGFVRRL